MQILADQKIQAFHQGLKSDAIGYYQWQRVLLGKINDLLNSSDDLSAIFPKIISILALSFQVDGIFVQFDGFQGEISPYWVAKDTKVIKLIEILLHQEKDNFNNLIEQNQIYQVCYSASLIDDIANFSLLDQETIELFLPCSIVGITLFVRQELFGKLILYIKDSQRILTPQEIETLQIVVNQLAIVIPQIELQERLNYLEAENKNLQEASQNKSDYLSHMNHELRTPLSGILGFAKMLRDEIYGSLNQKQKQYVNGIAVSGEHLLALVNDFLDLSKIEAQREEIFLETIAVEDLCLSAISIVESKAKEQGIDLIVDIGNNVDFCTVDQRRIKQILLNLLSNAIKFTEKGSVTLQVKSDREILSFGVIDTGIGIKEEDQTRLFQPFQQIQSHLSRKHKGTGLGLILSRKLAELHGGDITLTSEMGKGSCFTLNIPIKAEIKEQ